MIDSSILQGKKAAYFTLGCKLNFAETSSVVQQLMRYGVRKAEKGEVADLCIVNTCSVTEVADHKCRQAIHRLVKQHPGAFVVVTGCYAQLKPQEIIETDGVDLVLGSEQKGNIIPAILNGMTGAYTVKTADIKTFAESCSRGDRTRYFLKVQDGCNYYCTYCTIPIARGRSRNGSIASMVEQAERVAQEGGKEIVITGVNIGDFGRSTGETFFDLVKAMDKVEGIERYRISSIEPNLLTDEIIEFCAGSRAFMPHFHIPLQSGCDEVLRLMHRHYDTALFRSKIEKIRQVMPDAFIGVDVIVGTRGETADYFERAYDFMRSIDVSQYHVFSYSERPGTKALEIPHVVTPQEKHERSQRVLALSAEKTHDFYARFIGSTRPVLLEHASPRKPMMNGFTDNYIRVEVPNRPEWDNQIVQVQLGGFNQEGDALMGEIKA
ncbi:MAG: tRNA (N(6)-L-threonylcarbamoyladenosine(37)-C(2))-methylthiotransferase MtaB [Bacteroidaceae bacterium]|nr:tRNA (N(6)-L-threonylcarbamoyladenosine(37)-C(2))-methylthiotransferase MtaB [Bacteroidaceae bacterium]MBR1520673.1 tRNA (N(6)-L-threonylcarbamoyladenosine(37)-C(2))-methylthiotransferase MtaB [Bacteroidaceae bacterium]